MKQKTFLNTWAEWHSFVLGWSSAVYPFKTEHLKTETAKKLIEEEPWYYSFGLAMGIFTWAGIITGIAVNIIILIGGIT
jgi:hypothetical protein